MGQGDSARDYDPSESMKNAGILDVFPIFYTARLGQKIRRSPQSPLCGVALTPICCEAKSHEGAAGEGREKSPVRLTRPYRGSFREKER